MLHPDGLSGADFRAYLRALRTSQTVQYHVALSDLAGNHRSSITSHLMNGQVLGDLHHFGAQYGPTRRLMLSITDPGGALDVDPASSAAEQTMFLSTLVHVHHVLRVDELGDHVHCPVFVGRPSDLERTGDTVTVTGDDMAVLGMGQAWSPLHIPRHTPKVEAIRRILAERMGVVRFDFPAGKSKPVLHKSVNLGRMARPWAVATRIAESMDMQLVMRPDGVCVLRHWPRRVSYTFDPSGEIVAPLEADTTVHGFKDLIEILGHRPHGGKHRVRAVARPHEREPYSPESLAFNGVPQYQVLRQKHPHMRSQAEADRKAERLLEDRQAAVGSRHTVDVIPLPMLLEGDRYAAVDTTGDHGVFRLGQFTFPIGVDGGGGEAPVMSLGYHRAPPAWWVRRQRRKKRGRHHHG